MPPLRHQRRRRRKRRSPYQSQGRSRRNLTKFIPSSDSDFAFTANSFALYLAHQPDGCGVSETDAAEVSDAVSSFRAALMKALDRSARTQQTIDAKNEARRHAEEVIRKHANIIRANPEVDAVHKKMLRLKERPKRSQPRTCPQHPPLLEFLGSGDGVRADIPTGSGSGVHVLRFWHVTETGQWRKAKPKAAVRLELFVDLVPPGEPVPMSPMDRVRAGRGWPWYLRSFTKGPIEVEFPLPSEPRLVVYWARWADASGETSRFSQTCVARLEGCPQRPAAPSKALAHEERIVVEQPIRGHLETRCIIMQMPYAETFIAGALPAADAEDEHHATVRRLDAA